MKLRNIRGPNCVEASVSATIMIEKTTPTTVMTARGHGRSAAGGRVGAAPRSRNDGSVKSWL